MSATPPPPTPDFQVTDSTTTASPSDRGAVRVLLVGGSTLVLEFGGVRLLTDPTFDPPGEHPLDPAGTRVLTKTTGPAVPPEQIGSIDAVLLSHDQHPDNLDDTGRKLLARVPVTFMTPSAAGLLGGTARSLSPWRHTQLRGSDGRQVRVTAVPARHGPDGTEHALREVTGFVLAGGGVPRVYVSGDNSSLDVAPRSPTTWVLSRLLCCSPVRVAPGCSMPT